VSVTEVLEIDYGSGTTMSYRLRTAILGTFGFLAAMLLFVVASLRFAATSRAVEHRTEAKLAIAELRLDIIRADKGAEDYAISGGSDRNDLFQNAKTGFRGNTDRVRMLVADDPRQLELLQEIDSRITPRLVFLQNVITERDQHGREAALAMFETYLNGRGVEVRTAITGMMNEEDVVLADQRAAGRRASIASVVGASLSSLFFALLVVFAWNARRAQELAQQTEEAKRAQLEAENAALTERAQVTTFQERFMAVLGHDLRNPLGAISMGVDLLKREVPSEDKTLQRMASSSQRMARMIDQLLDLTRSRLGGGIELTVARMDLGKVTSDIVDELRTQQPAARFHVTANGDLRGRWDSDRLAQVISNLVGNALHHGTVDKTIEIKLDGTESAVAFSVRNEGKTIPEALQNVLFDPFRRGDRHGNSSKTAGLGLGLFISKEIITGHGGSITVSSSDSAGTTFAFKLPRVTEPRAILDDVPKRVE
jgi:signal transduction histidine kinase